MSWTQKLQANRQAVVLLTVMGFLLVCMAGSTVWWLWGKKNELQSHIEMVNGRFSRLLALDAQRNQVAAALQRLQGLQAEQIYPASVESSQVANTLQQQLRNAMLQAGLVVTSSQVQLPDQEQDTSAQGAAHTVVQVVMSVDGTWEAVQKALSLIENLKPYVMVEELSVQLNGPLHAQVPHAEPRLMTRWVFSTFQSKAGA